MLFVLRKKVGAEHRPDIMILQKRRQKRGTEGMVNRMSDDLISRKAFMEYLGLEDTEENREENAGEIVTLEDFDKQATAFDEEKVIEELEDYLFEKYCVEGDEKIAEIVEKGGIEGYEDGTDNFYNAVVEIIRKHMNDGWIPVEERLPESTDYILLSFSNFSLPTVGRYEEDSEGGAFYLGDDEETCVSQGLYVNAWRPLPEPYQPETAAQRPEWKDRILHTFLGGQAMIDDHRVRQMAREYEMNPSVARRLLEGARDVPALRIGRRYQEMTGGDAGGNEKRKRGKEGIPDAVPGCGQIREADRRGDQAAAAGYHDAGGC